VNEGVKICALIKTYCYFVARCTLIVQLVAPILSRVT